MRPSPDSRPRLAPGCRLSDAPGQKTMLMLPEKALRLLGPSLQIVERCDGRHTVAQIVSELQKLYAQAKPEKVEQDILEYLALLHEKRAVNFE
ncbi:MAG TPA: pyrroloquinoline quinone biosynthesis peptide chaperone PqqD [Candidatus Acidoferrales bacterium]|nr:pyrroloquinoline quinone biosynthesis peptide chaperone PqqD [Candidatus Acidoferrales bacterium]